MTATTELNTKEKAEAAVKQLYADYNMPELKYIGWVANADSAALVGASVMALDKGMPLAQLMSELQAIGGEALADATSEVQRFHAFLDVTGQLPETNTSPPLQVLLQTEAARLVPQLSPDNMPAYPKDSEKELASLTNGFLPFVKCDYSESRTFLVSKANAAN